MPITTVTFNKQDLKELIAKSLGHNVDPASVRFNVTGLLPNELKVSATVTLSEDAHVQQNH